MSDRIDLGQYVVGEKPAPLIYTFKDSDGVVMDLSEYTAQFVYREADGAATTRGAVVTNALLGEVTYTWDGSEFSGPGSYLAEIWVGNNLNRFCSWLITYTVRLPVGSVPTI
jgi:hypothetical protein